MAHEKEIQIMEDRITAWNGGNPCLCFGDIKKLLKCGKNTVPNILHEAGITIKRIGRRKCASAYSVAELMCENRISPINNDR